jgi:hypothetical protein
VDMIGWAKCSAFKLLLLPRRLRGVALLLLRLLNWQRLQK